MGASDLSQEVRARITDQFFERLISADSPLVSEATLSALLARQVELLLHDLGRGARSGLRQRIEPSEETLRSAADFSSKRASLEIHPTETVRAAGLFYELTLPVLVREALPEAPAPEAVLDLALTLHDAVMTQIALGCVGYIKFLREKIHSSHLDERRRLARDLHDRVSHDVLVALLGLEQCEDELDRDPGLTRTKLRSVEHTLREALHAISELSGELRDSVSYSDLERSLGQFLESAAPDGVEVSLTVTGDILAVPEPVAEELYYMLREAVKNALRHSAPKRIRIRLHVSESAVHASVSDNGTGFDMDTVWKARHDGITSIHERTELLGGICTIRSSVGSGTTVRVSIPLVTS
ncbi:hypothetical protein HUT19_34195 [Streptomyces sp. NA02950]|uniref:sensor histidine kinase n=1 Tax=Streptomyces sp. NA02950 TaxID=2742137 RepID=UPI0015919E9A|nr:ATP-binding protein [Streptomyces sp. NA02950]QKV96152.1 hypothetical protein HUT19_34195 [Streptomyces sp. NA02950]